MSIWKSPIFYLGLILVAAILAALAAPFVVNWDGYRDNLESYGRKLSGRDVAINGPISVRLFPWPRLSAEDVSVANPRDFNGPAMMNARRVSMELALASLFSGEIRVEAINIDHPVINVVRLGDGRGNWVVTPDAAVSSSRLLDHVKLDSITIADGVLHVEEASHHFSNTLTALNADVSAAALEGPWRLRATALQGQTPVEISFSSAEWKTGEAFRFGGKLTPTDGSLPAFAFDGSTNEGEFTGKLRVEPVVSDDGRSSLDGHFKPLQMQADVKASFENIHLDKIHIVPADSKDSGTLIEGSAAIALADGVKAQVNLSSPRVDLDALAGQKSLGIWQADGLMSVLNNLMKEFPQNSDLTGTFSIANLSMAGQTLENVEVETAAEPNALRIRNFSASLPGRSRMKFNGLVFPGQLAAELGGSLAIESNDARNLAVWLWPDGKVRLAKVWTGSRGRLKAQTDVSWSAKSFGFQNFKYELDGAAGSADVIVGLGPLPALNLQLKADRLDLDNYVSTKISYVTDILPLLQNSNGVEKRLGLQVGKLNLNGVEAQDVTLDYQSSSKGFEIRKLAIGSIEGGRVNGQGLIIDGPDGPSGEIKLDVKAENPRGLLRLVGAIPLDHDPSWVGPIGQTDMQGTISVKPATAEPLITYDLSGVSGPFHVSTSGDVKDIAQGSNAKLGISSEITTATSDDVIRLFGFNPAMPGAGAGKLTLTASGSIDAGFNVVTKLEALGGEVQYEGQFKSAAQLPQLNGKFTARFEDGKSLALALGFPAENIEGAIQAASPVMTQEGQIRFTKLEAKLAEQKISGDFTVTGEGEIGADLDMDLIDLKALLQLSFMDWNGKAPEIDNAFASAPKDLKSAFIWLRPKFLQTGFGPRLQESVIGISFDDKGRNLTIATAGSDGGPFKLDVSVKPRDARFDMIGSVQMAVDLEQNLKLQSGAAPAKGIAIVEGRFTGEGRSPAAVFTNLEGNGTVLLQKAKLLQISPQNFFMTLAKIGDAGALQLAFDRLLTGPGFEVGDAKQGFSVTAGVGNLEPILVNSPDANVQIRPSYDFANGLFDSEIVISAAQNLDLPAMRVTYGGAPGSLVQRKDTAEISAKLGYSMIAKDIAELDRVQAEQAKIVANEEAQRKADEEKFAAFQAQRAELRLRQRELKVFAVQRALDLANEKAKWEKVFSDSNVIMKEEMPRLLQQLH